VQRDPLSGTSLKWSEGAMERKAWLPGAPGELIEYVFYKSHRKKRSDREIYLERLTPCESSPLFKKKYRLYSSSSFSTPVFFTLGFHISSGIQAGAPLGFFT